MTSHSELDANENSNLGGDYGEDSEPLTLHNPPAAPFPSIREQFDGVGFDLADEGYEGDEDDEDDEDEYYDYDDSYTAYDSGYNDGWIAAYDQYAIMRLFRRLKYWRSTLKWKVRDSRRALLRHLRPHDTDSDIPF